MGLIEHRYRVDLRGLRSPFDLYAAISRVLPEAHGAGWAISPAGVGFVVRGPERAPTLEGLLIAGSMRDVQLVESVALAPARRLRSSCVIVRLTDGAPDSVSALRARVETHVRERAAALGVRVELGEPAGVRVHGRLIRGFAARAFADTDEAAIALLRTGIGGKRSMGCGVFFAEGQPWR